ncbi:MAG: hypothetical protein RLZZ234_838 [Candidatus Parcubacteria bacterium]|jgi:regulator of protease activity HflC (stomatin/prohibitin superfamily)
MGYFALVLIIIIAGVSTYYGAKHLESALGTVLRRLASYGTPLLIVILTAANMFWQVPAGYVGIVYTFGAITDQRSDGLQVTKPWASLVPASVQIQSWKFEKLDSFSVETQDVYVAATINVQVSPENIQNLYREVGKDWFNTLVAPRVNQAFKDETVRYSSVAVAPNREKIRRAVAQRLTDELRAHSITVQDLLIDNISFSPMFQDAIEKKQANTQNALAERAKVEAEKAKADQAIETARGRGESILIEATKQAEANKKLSESITPQYVQYLFASKLAPNVSVMMIPAGQEFILNTEGMMKTTAEK